jgi:hypothetical protein
MTPTAGAIPAVAGSTVATITSEPTVATGAGSMTGKIGATPAEAGLAGVDSNATLNLAAVVATTVQVVATVSPAAAAATAGACRYR